ncbi:MAG: TldD/PmbA family protein [Fidelibacterota bacterium]
MFEKLKTILARIDADYADIRYEIKKETAIVFNGNELTSIGSNSTDGYVIRVLRNGGLSSIAYTKETDTENAIRTVVENALLISKNKKVPTRFAKTGSVKDTFIPQLNEDPRSISMEEKLELTRKYNSIPLHKDKIATTNIGYSELIREKYFVSSEGSEIREELITPRVGGTITAKDGNILQNVRVGIGGSSGFAILRNVEEQFEKKTSIAIQLLKAKPVKAGAYDVIINPDLAGVFTHEAFGHFSEADLIEDSPSMREKMKLGAKLGNEILNIKDDPTLPDQLGHYKYDDEGVEARPTQLMKGGVLTGRLHSRRTAAAFDEPISGHCVAEDYRFAPIIRMGTIFIEPGDSSIDDLFQKLDDGLYLLDAKGGETSGENFTFGTQYGYVVKNGKIVEMIRDVNISGNLYQTLKNIVAIGNDLELCRPGMGGCGKGHQSNIRSCHGAPHILIKNVVCGGA